MMAMGMTVELPMVMGMTCEDGGDGQDGDNGADGDVAIPEYLGHPCCPRDMANKDPTDFFQLFVTDAMLEAAVEQTDLFAQQFINSHDLARRSRVQQWEWSPHDLKKFLAMTIIMGLINYPCMYGGLLDHFMAICHRHV